MSPDLHHLSGAYSVDALETDERTEFEQHLAVCPACRSEVVELREAAHAVGALTEATPPASLRANVLAGITRVRPLPPPADPTDDITWSVAPGSTSRSASTVPTVDVVASAPVVGESSAVTEGAKVIPFMRRTTTWIAGAAAAAVLAVGGLVWAPFGEDPSTAPPQLTAVQRVEKAPDATTVTKHQGGVTATLAFSPSLDRSALTVDGMPPVREGKIYQLWYIGSGGARSAGFLRGVDDGQAEAVLNGSLVGAKQVGVTVEPAGGSTSPTTAPVMVLSLA